MPMNNDKDNNPLKILWNLVSSIGGIVGLSSLAENWISDLMKWKGWIESVINSYQSIVYPVFEWLLAWLPWGVPSWAIDYIVLGIIFVTSMSKGITPDNNESFKTKFSGIKFSDAPLMIIFYLSLTIFWPIMFFLTLRNYVFEKADDFRDTLLWFASIFLGFFILLSVNAAL